MLESFDFPPPAFLRCLHDTYLEPTDVLVNLSPVDGLPVHCRVGGCANGIFRCHPLLPLSRVAGLSREKRPEGSLPAFAWSRERYGLTVFRLSARVEKALSIRR